MTDSLPMPITALTKAQRTAILNLVRRASKAEILPRFRALSAADISQKTGPQDLVTEADIEAEKMIARGLLRQFPNALIVGEEACSRDPELAGRIAEADLAFTIDPVDGTWNYAAGLATFGVMISMTRYGRPVFGMLYDPLADDVIMGSMGEGAFMQRPRRAPRSLSVRGGGRVDTLSGYVPLFQVPEEKRPETAVVMTKFERVNSLRCSCHEFRTFIQGHVDFVLSGGLTPWDHAPGALIAAEAGAHVAFLDGELYSAERRDGFLLSATNAATWGKVRDVFSHLIEETPVTPKAPEDVPEAAPAEKPAKDSAKV